MSDKHEPTARHQQIAVGQAGKMDSGSDLRR
jgi:hypothetical protein